jgi:ribonuclease P protein component
MKKKFVLKKNNDFKRLIDNRVYVINNTFTVYYTPNHEGHSRFGVSVGKKQGNAVVRNKLKRQIRMMIDEVFVFSLANDYLIMIRKDYNKQTFEKNLNELNKLNKKIQARGAR